MELKDAQTTIEKLLTDSAISEYFTAEQLSETAREMIVTIESVLKNEKLERVEFGEDDKMLFNFEENFIHLGLGMIKKMINTWYTILSGGGIVFMGAQHQMIPREFIREYIISSLRGIAAHEGGHRIIHLNPIRELGVTIETLNQLGLSYLLNALFDCQNDGRIMNTESTMREDVVNAREFNLARKTVTTWIHGKIYY